MGRYLRARVSLRKPTLSSRQNPRADARGGNNLPSAPDRTPDADARDGNNLPSASDRISALMLGAGIEKRLRTVAAF